MQHLQTRVRMPWNPKFLNGQLTIFLRRNLGHGKVLEGLEVSWGKVAAILQALTQMGRWRLDAQEGPMHKYYDPRLFDVLSFEEINASLAPKDSLTGQPRDCREASDFVEAGFDVRFLDGDAAEEADDVEAGALAVSAFVRWMECCDFQVGSCVARWWVHCPSVQSSAAPGVAKMSEQETAYDLFAAILAECEGRVDVPGLVLWMQRAGGGLDGFLLDGGCPRGADGGVDWVLVAEDMVYEFAVANAHFKDMDESGTAEHDGEGRD